MGELPQIVRTVTDEYLVLADDRLPGRIDGLYLSGSVSYGDFWANSSDIDFVAVTAGRLTPEERPIVQEIHSQLAQRFRRPHFDGMYASPEDLRVHPDGVPALLSFHEGKGAERKPDVITWGTLRQSSVVRGAPLENAWSDGQAVKDYSRQNLAAYWRDKWLRSQQGLSPKAAASLGDWGIHWGVLGIPRLVQSIETGEVISKTAGGMYALDHFGSQWERIVREALRIRREEGAKSLYRTPLSRRRDALAFQEHTINAGLVVA